MDCSLPGSSVRGILQTRILEWVAISFSRGSSQPRDWTWVSCIGRRILYCWTTGEARVLLLASSTNRSEILLNIHQFIGHLPQQIIHFQLSTFLLLRIRVVWVHLYLSEYYRDQVRASLVAQTEKSLPSMLETWVRFLGLGRSPGEGNGNPLWYSCLENSMDGGAWRPTVHGIAKSRTWLST